jgi:hypothetical protein
MTGGFNGMINKVVDQIVVLSTDILMPMMLLVFLFGISLRVLIWFTVSREYWYTYEFSKRVHAFLEDKATRPDASFYVTLKRLMEKTYYELFEVRAKMMRRRPDAVRSLADRLFLIQHGCARLVRDTLKQVKWLRYDGQHPRFLEISKNTFENNGCFNKVFGVLPVSGFNDFLNALPGLFIVGGIFGTFLGIMQALPDLSTMDLTDVEGTKTIMDTFLLKVAYSMSTSIVGIIFSVCQQLLNTALSPEKTFVSTVNRFESSLNELWFRCKNNLLPEDLKDFDEHKDPLEALASEAVEKENDRKGFNLPRSA